MPLPREKPRNEVQQMDLNIKRNNNRVYVAKRSWRISMNYEEEEKENVRAK